ncbi:MAG TPA: hypothetical protein VD866_28505 [Urbifossiella sp.]|nr:hypothetical protein [Urbifossiella sp.]
MNRTFSTCEPRFDTDAPLRPSFVELTAGVTMWEKAHDQLLSIARLEADWDGDGADPIRPELIRSASKLLRWARAQGYKAPQDVYPMPDGCITVEWQRPDDVIERIEIQGADKGLRMFSYPDRPATFEPFNKWATVSRFQPPLVAAGAALPPTACASPKSPRLHTRQTKAETVDCEWFPLAA